MESNVSEYRPIRVALLGAGSVGAEVARLLLSQKAELASRIGAELELVGVAVRDLKTKRNGFPKELLTTDAESLILSADIVIEVMGGLQPAKDYILLALNSGSDVITANKSLLATHGSELFSAAEQVGAQLYFEASVAGAIPIIRPLRESLAGDRVKRIMGIVNGSTNYILDRMDKSGATLEVAMKEATELGYLEADPSLDVDGYDAAQKAAILASLAFHTEVPLESVYREGITGISAEQIAQPHQQVHDTIGDIGKVLEDMNHLAEQRDVLLKFFTEMENASYQLFQTMDTLLRESGQKEVS
jgi:homoserine dehydrogenase